MATDPLTIDELQAIILDEHTSRCNREAALAQLLNRTHMQGVRDAEEWFTAPKKSDLMEYIKSIPPTTDEMIARVAAATRACNDDDE